MLATAEAWDAEMADRIARHRADRAGDGGRRFEAPLDLCGALAAAGRREVTLVDCATLWLTNHMLAGHDLMAEGERLLAALRPVAGPFIVVTNEVGWGIVPRTRWRGRFAMNRGG